jgi:hypothetical protein
MSAHTSSLYELSDAAGLLVAQATGDTEASHLVISHLVESRDFAGAILLLSHTVNLAGTALRYELTAAEEEGRDTVPSLSFLVAASGEARRRAAAGDDLPDAGSQG